MVNESGVEALYFKVGLLSPRSENPDRGHPALVFPAARPHLLNVKVEFPGVGVLNPEFESLGWERSAFSVVSRRTIQKKS